MWILKSLISHCQTQSTCINEKWVPSRPINGTKKYAFLSHRIKDAWEVFMCRAEAFTWPENQ